MGEWNRYTTQTKIEELSQLCRQNYRIDPELYTKYDVKRGLRDINGKGVCAGLTNVSQIIPGTEENGETKLGKGQLLFRGYHIEDLVNGFVSDNRFGYEETVYLLLFGELPSKEQLEDFSALLRNCRTLPPSFTRDVIMKSPSEDMMNTLAKSVLALYSYDHNPNDTSIANVLRQCIQLIAQFPSIAVYGYQAFRYYKNDKSLFLHQPDPKLSAAENLLSLLRNDQKFTQLEAKLLDLALVLHAEHGGGNNSTFTVHVVSSSGTDTYSTMAAALGSLKGPKHGGANIKVVQMFDDMKERVHDWKDEEEVSDYLRKLLHKDAFDHAGLIYGMGHAVYSQSDPRATILHSYARQLADEKHCADEFALYETVERLAPQIIAEERRIYKGVCANVDFYSGMVYRMLNLPNELFTPIFAVARIAGWSAHRLEELLGASKIIRPAYRAVKEWEDYTPLSGRE
ncbi:MAG: citrate/2-methylcitrate synthase [Oscillospiraceae bacterium]|nr:citrate/2-methylcitrate synthase [Oscillospiraceae bacterium]MBR5723230.1 citrate/2-methylcitrate synthase [Oscillospiraceae bacterium]